MVNLVKIIILVKKYTWVHWLKIIRFMVNQLNQPYMYSRLVENLQICVI